MGLSSSPLRARWTRSRSWGNRSFSASRRLFEYGQNGRNPQSEKPRVYQGVPVPPGEIPPGSTFDGQYPRNARGGYQEWPGQWQQQPGWQQSWQQQAWQQQGWQQGPPPPPPPPRRPPGFFRRVIGSTSMRAIMGLAFGAALAFYFTHLEVVPVSGRRRFNCVSDETVQMLGEMQYEQLMEEAKKQGHVFLADYDPRTLVVLHVLRRLLPVAGEDASGWEVHVIDDPGTANAFVLPNGKVFVFSGLFRLAQTEDALAAVLGHELAHNLANHHGERASSAIGSTVLLFTTFFPDHGLAYFVLSPVLEVVFNSPMSRLQESEADYIGLMLMAEACFDPREAAQFWRRMDQASPVDVPEWISTHPSNQHRLEKIQGWMDEALERRQQSSCSGTRTFAEQFKRALRSGVLMIQ